MDLGLRDLGVLVTGGAGGIGTAVVRAFAAEGARVAVHYRSSAEAATALADEVGGVALAADLTDEAETDQLVPTAVAALGRLDICVANAGEWPTDAEPLWDISLDRWRRTLDANLTARFLTARAFLRHVATTGTGSLVMVSSTAGLFGEADHADYAAAKGAIASGLLLSLKNEMVRIAPRGRVNVVAPGWTVTPMAAGRLTSDDLRKVSATAPLEKFGEPDDVARSVVWLSSDAAAGHVTGQVVTVAGGMEGRLLR
jgi:3-oxoacyl-[acyl-carrier protein] reductase